MFAQDGTTSRHTSATTTLSMLRSSRRRLRRRCQTPPKTCRIFVSPVGRRAHRIETLNMGGGGGGRCDATRSSVGERVVCTHLHTINYIICTTPSVSSRLRQLPASTSLHYVHGAHCSNAASNSFEYSSSNHPISPNRHAHTHTHCDHRTTTTTPPPKRRSSLRCGKR